MYKILLFAGTTEGRLLTEYLSKQETELFVCVASDYGANLLPPANEHLTISAHRMDGDEMHHLMATENFNLVIDATHPFATDVTQTIKGACAQTQTPYLRVLRDSDRTDTAPATDAINQTVSTDEVNLTISTDVVNPATSINEVSLAASTDEAIDILRQTTGPIFLTTGSKTLPDYMTLPDATDRLFVRILPNPEMLMACQTAGLPASHIFCMQGPFDTDINIATIKHVRRLWMNTHAACQVHMVTKQSGAKGGFEEKYLAAEATHSHLIIIGRPAETEGITLSEAYTWLAKWGHFAIVAEERLISLIGMGMSRTQLTLEADAALRDCNLIIGAKRMVEMASDYHKPSFCSYDYQAITDYIVAHPAYRHVAILFSGDIGFYSGAAKMRRCLSGLPLTIQAFSGIASPIYFLNTIGKPWQDVHLVSGHGQPLSIVSQVRTHSKLLALLGKPEDVSDICHKLITYGLSDVRIYTGSNLGSPEEALHSGTPADFAGRTLPSLSVIYIENDTAAQTIVTPGLPDCTFTRGKVPMTKSEIRSIVLSKLALTQHAVLYDIGAGTGSIAIEAAMQVPEGHVYAIEKNPEGLSLIQTNSEKMQVDNMTIIPGIAPDCMRQLPAATHAFIGGSTGHMSDILDLLDQKNPDMHIVITAITLETLSEVLGLIRTLDRPEPSIVQVQVNGTKKAGPYHLMEGQNPVFIITL